MNSATSLSLFPMETKTEARQRAKKIFELLASLRDAPVAIECREGQIGALMYFVTRAAHRKLDANDNDGLQRLIGNLEELISSRDAAFMRRHRRWWKPLPDGWPGSGHYCTTLHPKEMRYLNGQVHELQSEIEKIKANVPDIEAELESLRQHGPLPAEIAEKSRLTMDGRAAKQESNHGT